MQGRVLIVYPTLGNVFYLDLGKRLRDAAVELGMECKLVGSSNLNELDSSWSSSIPVFIVNPNECLLSGVNCVRVLDEAPFRGAVLAECVGTEWYKKTLKLDMEFDLLIDVGFLDQSKLHPRSAPPYRLLFNAPLPKEANLIECSEPGGRYVNWAVVAHVTPDRLALVEQLTSKIGPGGFAFLPQLRPVRPETAMLSPASLHRVLRRTDLYVWCSHHSLPYYESFRFLDAMMCGAVPCKVETETRAELSGLPNIFRSVEDLSRALEVSSPKGLFEVCKDFSLSNGTFTDHFGQLLYDCLPVKR
jgi:hypothetical protein